MKELFDFTAKQVTDSIAQELQEELGISKALAKKAVINALIYNCVIEEVKSQAAFLLGMDE